MKQQTTQAKIKQDADIAAAKLKQDNEHKQLELQNERAIKQAELQAKQGDEQGKMQVQNQKAMESREAHQVHMLENQQKMELDRQKGDSGAARAPDEGQRHGAARQRAADGGAGESDEPEQREAAVSDSWMGSIAAQNDYRPLGNDPWSNTIALRWQPPADTAFYRPSAKLLNESLNYTIAPDRGAAFGTMTPQEETVALPERAKAAVDVVMPQSPIDFIPGGKAVRMGSLAANIALDPSEAQAAAKSGPLWSPLSLTKMRKPLSEMEHKFTDIRQPEIKYVDPASMVGGHLILTPWDLSRANRTLTHVDNIPLDTPVRAHGGSAFPEANRGMAAASEHAFAKPLDNLAAEYAQKGPVYIAPMTMSPQGIDASHHVADPLAQLVRKAPIKRGDVKAFNDMMREQVPDWVNIKSKKFPDYIRELEGGMTTKALMADRMALREWQDKGFPDVAAVRHAMTEPSLIDAPRNTWGMAISRYEPGKGLLKTTHPSYSKGVAGQWMGQLAQLAPYEFGMPAAAEGLARHNAALKTAGRKNAVQPAYHAGKPIKDVPRAQYLDQEWLDRLMKQQSGD